MQRSTRWLSGAYTIIAGCFPADSGSPFGPQIIFGHSFIQSWMLANLQNFPESFPNGIQLDAASTLKYATTGTLDQKQLPACRPHCSLSVIGQADCTIRGDKKPLSPDEGRTEKKGKRGACLFLSFLSEGVDYSVRLVSLQPTKVPSLSHHKSICNLWSV